MYRHPQDRSASTVLWSERFTSVTAIQITQFLQMVLDLTPGQRQDVLRAETARLLVPVTGHDAPAVLAPHPDDVPWAERTALQLLDEHHALGRRPLDLHHALRRSLLESLLLRLAHRPDTAPPPLTARAVGAPRSTGVSSTHWNCTSASCTTSTTTPACSAARSAPSPEPPGPPTAPEHGR